MSERVAVKDVSKTYRLGKVDVTALAGVSLVVKAGEFLAVAGPSGSGKTTLLNLIGCLDTPTSGEVAIDGEAISGLSSGRRADLRARKLGFVFQTFNLIPVLTAWENVEYPLLLQRGRRDASARCRAASSSVSPSPARSSPSPLSCSPTSRPPTSTAAPATRSSS
jgi:putative ABC transport system ATP-binding protein